MAKKTSTPYTELKYTEWWATGE
ncbi:hypothetical protein C5S31_07405, partial [ANME-1 cluster archaeon GoMg2]|nr:hypothetical protein [ANME-1 cluster archaeon GoMg2]